MEGTSSEVGYGGTVLLNCSSSCPEAGAPGGLETSLSKEWVGRGPGWLSIRLYNITEPLSDVFCYFYCFGERKVATFRVLAYGKRPLGSFPRGFPCGRGPGMGDAEGGRDALDLGSPPRLGGQRDGANWDGAGAATGLGGVGARGRDELGPGSGTAQAGSPLG